MHPGLLLMTANKANLHFLQLSSIQSMVEYWMDNWTVSDVTGHAGVTGRYLENAIISDKSK